MKPEYTISAIVLALVVLGGAWLLSSGKEGKTLASEEGVPYVEIAKPSGFVNTNGITIGEFIGKKVVLVEFLTYSCINCQRTFPHVVSWYSKYKDEGLEIIGIHTPEFAFEKDIDNVRKAMEEFGITYPIVLDNDYATWNAYGNKYWPRKYLINIHGNIVYDHIGEGNYEETEEKIRELLKERASVLDESVGADTATPMGSVATAPLVRANSPETYFGSLRNTNFGNGRRGIPGVQTLIFPETFLPNTLYLKGTWNIQPEYVQAEGKGSVVFKYDATKVYVVASSDTPVSVEVLVDGVLTKTVTVNEEKLYTLVDDMDAGTHLLELRVDSTKIRYYAFTFG